LGDRVGRIGAGGGGAMPRAVAAMLTVAFGTDADGLGWLTAPGGKTPVRGFRSESAA
jgi:hypothetical protein